MSNRVKRPSSARNADQAASRRLAVETALAAGDIPRAAMLAEAALGAGDLDTMLFNLAAWRREEGGDYAGAHDMLRRALTLAPGDVMILGAIGAVLRKERRLDEALSVLDRVVAAEPRHAAAWLERGYTLDALRDEQGAAASYRRALAIDPALAPAFGKLADGAARRGEVAEARAMAARALAIDPGETASAFALASLDIEQRDGPAAEARLQSLLTRTLAADDRTRALTLLGDALDRQDRTAEAFASYRDAQAHFRETYRHALAPSANRPSHRAFIERIAEQVEAMTAPPRRYAETGLATAARRHVFLLGYPRSGTTLVENVLAGAPDVIALEERDTLQDADEALIALDGSMPPLDQLPQGEIDRLRSAYWNRVTALAGDVSTRVLIDMHPLNGTKLPVIARLFPDSRIVIMRRDPRDVILSCFRIDFTPGSGAWALSDLDDAARHYDAMMHLIELCRQRLPLAFHELRYDRLITDFDGTVRALAAFVGIDWTDGFRDFAATARTRGVTTASAMQVRHGLYDGRAQWRRYEAELAPAMPVLAPWLERFGYTTD